MIDDSDWDRVDSVDDSAYSASDSPSLVASDYSACRSHEFIDVVQSSSATWRYFVDLDFRAQFEIARFTRRFAEALASVRGLFVRGAEELKRTVSMACDAARRCFRSRGF